MERLARFIAFAELRGRDKGLKGASSAWLAIWVLSAAYRHLRKWAGPDPVVVREALLPGQQLVISHFPRGEAPPAPATGRRARRRQRKAARS